MGTLKDQLEQPIAERQKWEIRRQYGADGPNTRNLWILACMDERLPVDQALGIKADSGIGGGDAHLFHNAGGIVTDDAFRSAMLTINFFGTNEIIVLQHTECGMLSAHGDVLAKALTDKGIDLDSIPIDPSMPDLSLSPGNFAKGIGMMDDVDVPCMKTVEFLRNHPLIPDHVTISGWVWETEFQRPRAPINGPRRTGRLRWATRCSRISIQHRFCKPVSPKASRPVRSSAARAASVNKPSSSGIWG